jgi:hypothetical protein
MQDLANKASTTDYVPEVDPQAIDQYLRNMEIAANQRTAADEALLNPLQNAARKAIEADIAQGAQGLSLQDQKAAIQAGLSAQLANLPTANMPGRVNQSMPGFGQKQGALQWLGAYQALKNAGQDRFVKAYGLQPQKRGLSGDESLGLRMGYAKSLADAQNTAKHRGLSAAGAINQSLAQNTLQDMQAAAAAQQATANAKAAHNSAIFGLIGSGIGAGATLGAGALRG